MNATPARLAALHKAAFPNDPWSQDAFAAFLADPATLLVADADGFALLRVTLDEAEVLTFAVRPAAQGKGLGTRLLRKALRLAAARGARRVTLEVAADNATACALYAKEGFTRAGLRRGYYPRAGAPAVDGLLLARALG